MASEPRRSVLPPSCPPRGLNRLQAAEYIGVSASLLDEMIDRRMPKPRVINRRRVWDRYELDAAFEDLPHDGGEEPEEEKWEFGL